MSFSIDPDPESRLNEVKIILSTSIIEAGKTLSNLGLCIDLGIQTASIYNPLKFNINEKMYTLKQVPINLNQMVQRLGRIGRESPGIFVHFYSKTVVDKLLLNDYPDTINNPCLSNLILSYMKGVEKGKSIDIINENDFLYQTSVDILINSGRDLLNAGYLTKFGELVQLKNTYEFSDNWISYVMHLHLILGFSLWESLVLVCVNRKKLPPYFSIETLKFSTLQISLEFIITCENPSDEIIEGIQKARNLLTSISYNPTSPIKFVNGKQFRGRSINYFKKK